MPQKLVTGIPKFRKRVPQVARRLGDTSSDLLSVLLIKVHALRFCSRADMIHEFRDTVLFWILVT